MSDYEMRRSADGNAVNLVYILNFIGYLTLVTWIIAVVIAYAKRDGAHGAERSHFDYQIKTFWGEIMLIAAGILVSLTIIGIPIGILLCLAAFIWSIGRNITGFLAANDGYGVRNPIGWGFAERA